MAIDLHVHSTYSDGRESPSKVIENAVRDGLSAVALSDHDSTRGIPEARKRAQELGIDFIPGVELTVDVDKDEYNAKEIHILGLFIKPSEELEEIYEKIKEEKEEFSRQLAEALRQDKKWDIDIDKDIRKEFKGIVSVGTFGAYLVMHKFLNSFDEYRSLRMDLMDKRLLDCKAEYGIPADRAIRAIHNAGGLAFLAHPYRMRIDKNLMIQRIKKYKKLGLDGLECHYKNYGPKETEYITNSLQIACSLKLLVCGGSDYHEDKPEGRFPSGIGVPDEVLDPLRYKMATQKRIHHRYPSNPNKPQGLVMV